MKRFASNLTSQTRTVLQNLVRVMCRRHQATKRMHRWMFVITIVICVRGGLTKPYTESNLLLVSMDGFRWNYFDEAKTPNFDRLSKLGVKAAYITDTFPTVSFPCHYSIVTGLYEESHGILGRVMYDPVFDELYTEKSNESKWWDQGEPIWVTVRKHNKKSATYFWPGSEAEVHGYRPNIWFTYNESVPFKDRVDTVVEWFEKDEVNFATLYFHEPDRTGHIYGPNTPEMKEKVEYMDGILGYLMASFDEKNLWGSVNVIVMGDHGMAEIDFRERVVDISELVDMNLVYTTLGEGAVMQIIPLPGNENEVFDALNSSHPNMTIYWKRDIPDRWHYANNRRVMAIQAVADEGWVVIVNRTRTLYATRKGAHGYDNQYESMRSILFARGPNFKTNFISEPFLSVDVYPLMCKLMGIEPAPNNGSLNRTEKMTSFPVYGQQSTVGHTAMLLFIAFVMSLHNCLKKNNCVKKRL